MTETLDWKHTETHRLDECVTRIYTADVAILPGDGRILTDFNAWIKGRGIQPLEVEYLGNDGTFGPGGVKAGPYTLYVEATYELEP